MDAARDLRWFAPDTHITVRGLRKAFGGVTVCDGFDIGLPRGKLVSVFGPNGCGKSSFIDMLAGLLPHNGGDILFDGKTVGRDAPRPRVPELPRGAVPLAARGGQHPLPAAADGHRAAGARAPHRGAARAVRPEVRPAPLPL